MEIEGKRENRGRKALIRQEKRPKMQKQVKMFKNDGKERSEAKVSKKTSKTIMKEIKQAMLEDLQRRGLTEPVYLDMVEEYLTLWELRRKLAKDVEERGVSVLDGARGGRTENRSISLGLQVSKQMLSLYNALGFGDRAKNAIAGAEEEDEL